MRQTRSKRPLFILFATFMMAFAWILPGDLVADGYRFVRREQLNRDLKKWVGKKFTTTDKITMVYTKSVKNHLIFDTTYFRCAIPTSGEGSDYINTIMDTAKKQYKDLRKELKDAKTESARAAVMKKIFKRWKKLPIVTIFGEVKRPEFWGKVDPSAKGAGVVSERIVLVLDKAEKPRKRWYKEIK